MPNLQNRPDRTLLAFDGYNIVRRVYGAMPGDDTPEKVEGALRSSLGSFKRAIKDFEPTHVLAAFDHESRTFRHEMYLGYKAKRKPMVEVLRQAMPTFFAMLRDIGIPVACIEGVEAEDVIATVSLKWRAAGKGRVVTVSTDKDVGQLVPGGVEVRDQFQEIWLDDAWCQKKFGVPIALLGDCLALMGDDTDGIPGVPNVGEKTAAKLLLQYGDLDGILANLNDIQGALGKRLQDNLDALLLSRELVALKPDVTLNMTWNQMVYNPSGAYRAAA
jgi:protein Xni